MKQQNGFIDPTVVFVGIGAVAIIGGLAFGLPQYGVYTKSLNGKAKEDLLIKIKCLDDGKMQIKQLELFII